MAATDTVVGIVGAVLLAGIMVAVFVYEYNNAPDDGAEPGDDTASLQRFNATYPALSATEDIDGDGIPNHKDADMDNDGTEDADQSGNLVVRHAFSGSISGPTPPAQTNSVEHTFTVASGRGVLLSANLTYQSQVPAVPGQSPVPNISIQLDGPEDLDASSSTAVREGNSVLVTVSLEDAVAGNYTLRITVGLPPQVQTPYEAQVAIDYGLARGASNEPLSPR